MAIARLIHRRSRIRFILLGVSQDPSPIHPLIYLTCSGLRSFPRSTLTTYARSARANKIPDCSHTCQKSSPVSSCSTCLFFIDTHHAPHIRCLQPADCNSAIWAPTVRVPLRLVLGRPLYSTPRISILRFPNLRTWLDRLRTLELHLTESTLLVRSLGCCSPVVSLRISIGHLWSRGPVYSELYFYIFTTFAPSIDRGCLDKCSSIGPALHVLMAYCHFIFLILLAVGLSEVYSFNQPIPECWSI